jgi:RND family efflux transporter MFP subunit
MLSRRQILPFLVPLALLPGCRSHAERSPAAAPPVVVATEAIAAAPLAADAWEATGNVEAIRRASPGTILAGAVTAIVRREGDRVRRGDILARVESGDVAARVAQAEAAAVAARAAEENARRMRDRLERLVPKQAASPRSLEDAVAGHEAAMAGVRAADEGVRAARVLLGYGQVRAPFDGVVVERRVEEGDTASPGMPMFVVEDTSRVRVDVAVPASTAGRVAEGMPVTVLVDGTAGAAREARVHEILPAADPTSRTITARVVLDNGDGAVRPGQFARVRSGDAVAAMDVAETAVMRRGSLAGVFVVETGVARLRWIALGGSRDGRVEILSGLSSGEIVVVQPPSDLTDGRRVESSR